MYLDNGIFKCEYPSEFEELINISLNTSMFTRHLQRLHQALIR